MTFTNYLANSPEIFAVTCLVFGLLVGSFLNVVIHRVPEMMRRQWMSDSIEFLTTEKLIRRSAFEIEDTSSKYNLWTPSSHCPSCESEIRAWQNVPVISYILMLGRCSNCKTKISIQYPIVELITGLLALAAALQFGFSIQTAFALAFTFSLVALTGIDTKTQLLPDSITLPLLWLGLIAGLFDVFVSLESAVIGAIAGYGSFWIIYQVFLLVTQREGMGMGDLKLLAALGAWLGWEQLPLLILISSITGSFIGGILHVLSKNKESVPFAFGPFLAIAGLICLYFGEPLSAALYGI